MDSESGASGITDSLTWPICPRVSKPLIALLCVLPWYGFTAAQAARSDKPPGAHSNDAEIDNDTSNKAKALFKSALAHYKAGEYTVALKELLSAQDLTPRKSIQLNIARTHLALGEAAPARQAYMALIRDYGNGLLAEQELTSQEREEAEQEITKACKKLVDSAEYREALAALTEAKEIVTGKAAKSIIVLMGRTHEALDDDVAAFRVYREALEANDAVSNPKVRLNDKEKSELTTALERVRRRTAIVKGNIRPAGVLIRAVDPKLGTTYLDTLDPGAIEQGQRQKVGRHILEFSKPGYVTERRTLELLPDDSVQLDITLRPIPTESISALSPDNRSPLEDIHGGGSIAAPPTATSLAQGEARTPTGGGHVPVGNSVQPAGTASEGMESGKRVHEGDSRQVVAPPVTDTELSGTMFYLGGGLWLPISQARALTYADQHPKGMNSGTDSPFRMSFDNKPKGLTAGMLLWGDRSGFGVGLNLMLQYRHFGTMFTTVGGTALGRVTYDEVLACICVGGGAPRSGVQFFLGPLLGGALGHSSLEQNVAAPFDIVHTNYFNLGFHGELRVVLFHYLYLAGGFQYTFSLSSIAVRDANGNSTLNFPMTSMQGGWLGLGLQI